MSNASDLALQESQSRFQAFMDNSPTIAFMKDAEGRYIYLNKPFERAFNITFAALQGKTDAQWLPAETAKPLQKNDQRVLATGTPMELLEIIPGADGSPRCWLSFKFLFQDSAGRRYVGGMAIDITERRRSEEVLESKLKELELVNRAMMGREERILELKEELRALRAQRPASAERTT